jgi:plasmid stabilization system protein ParE
MVTIKKVVWTENAEMQLEEIYQYTLEDSQQNAIEIKNKIFKSTSQLLDFPEKYPNDKYKKNNDGNFKAYEIYRFRISYYISEKEIVIIRIRSTDRKPKKY